MSFRTAGPYDAPRDGHAKKACVWVLKSQEEIAAEHERARHGLIAITLLIAAGLFFAVLVLAPRGSVKLAAAASGMGAIALVLRHRARVSRLGKSYVCPSCERTSAQTNGAMQAVACRCGSSALPLSVLKWVEQ